MDKGSGNNVINPTATLTNLRRNQKLAMTNKATLLRGLKTDVRDNRRPLRHEGDRVYVTNARVSKKDAPHIFTKSTTRTNDFWNHKNIYRIRRVVNVGQRTGGTAGPLFVYFLIDGSGKKLANKFYRAHLAAVDTENTTPNDTIHTYMNNID